MNIIRQLEDQNVQVTLIERKEGDYAITVDHRDQPNRGIRTINIADLADAQQRAADLFACYKSKTKRKSCSLCSNPHTTDLHEAWVIEMEEIDYSGFGFRM